MICLQKGCGREAEVGNLCNIHHWHNIWLDNRDPNNLGIEKFAKMIVPEWARNETPQFHREIYRDYFGLYSPDKKDKYDRLYGVIGFRGAAKTTLSKIILLYISCFGLEKFVVYCSETNAFAVQDVFEVRRELGTNLYIRQYFGIISSKAVRGQDGEWSRDAFLTATGVYVLARGVGQQVRSALRNSYRPTLAIVNDMYSKDSVKTEHSRTEYAKWFFQDMFNAIDDIDGKVFFNGTILHEDTVPVTLKQNSVWKTREYPVMDLDDFNQALALCKQTDSDVMLPDDEILTALQASFTSMAWPQRLSLRYILRKYKEAYESSQTAGFYQEYFHVVVPPGEKNFRNRQYAEMRFFKSGGFNWLAVDFGGKEVIYEVNTYIAVDPASATTRTSKFTAIVYIAMNRDRQIFVMGYSRGKFGMRDEMKLGFPTANERVVYDKTSISRIGMVDEHIRLVKQYGIHGAAVETVQQQQSVFDEINRLMRVNGAMHRLYSIKPTTEKIERDADTLMPYFQTNSIFFKRGMHELEQELESFPRGTTVDIIDALQMAVSIARPPSGADFSEMQRMGGKFKRRDEFTRNFNVL